MKSGKVEGLPYSFSRWTDVPASKWDWFAEQMKAGSFMGFGPHSPIPERWSLRPADTLGLIFWSKDPTRLLESPLVLEPYEVKLHFTITGWGRAMEPGSPDRATAIRLLGRATRTLGLDAVRWRLSPIPITPEVLDTFSNLAHGAAGAGLTEVYCSFLQPNSRIPETRSSADKAALLDRMGALADRLGIKVVVCQEETAGLLVRANVAKGVCAPPEDFAQEGPREACGCGLAVDPFTRNEACRVGCRYCYTTDPEAGKIINTTPRRLPVSR